MHSYTLTLLLAGTSLALGGESWQDKPPAQWTEKDVRQVLDHSPWIRQATAQFGAQHMGGGGPGSMDPSVGGGPPMGGGGGGGGMGGGMGGGGGMGSMGPGGSGGGAPGSSQMPTFAVRWASAAPMREAFLKSDAKSPIAGWSSEFYVIVMEGPPGMRHGAGEEADNSRFRRMSGALTGATTLRVKGKEAIHPARVEVVHLGEGQGFAFLFPRSVEISADDKEAAFETALGPMQVKAKFNLKQMNYQGKTAL